MKKIYLSICAIIISTAVFAQSRMAAETPQKEMIDFVANVTPSVTPSSSAVAPPPVWEDDCSDTADWVFTNTSIPPLDWRIESNSNLQALSVTTLPSSLTPFTSTSVANGFLWISSDAIPGNVDNDGTPTICEVTTANPIDLSAYPFVQLSFEHNFRWWKDTRGVRVSGDNGANWTEFELTNVNDYQPTFPNQNTNNPEITTINISAVAGGQSQVLVQFYYNDNDIWGWYWAVDDVKITEVPDNLIKMEEEVIGGWWVAYQTAGGVGLDYTLNPMSQVAVNPYSFESVLINEGLATQNVSMHVEVTETATQSSVYTGSSSPLTLTAGMQDTVVATPTFSPTNYGVYSIEMWGVGDSAFTDTAVKTTIVTDSVYGRDHGQVDGYWRVGRSCGGMVLGVDFDVYVTDDLTSVSTYVYGVNSSGGNVSVPGAVMFGALYEVDPQGDPIWLAQTDDYTIQQSDLDNWVTISFNGAQTLAAGTSYMIAIGGYAHPLDTFSIAVSGEGQGATNHIQDNGCNIGSGGFGDWYWISSIPMIRMNLGTIASNIAENAFEGKLAVYPNPTKGIFTIDLKNTIADNYAIVVSDMLGKEVYASSSFVNGNFNENIDLSAFDKGVYLLTISNSNTSITEKIVIE